MITGNIGCGGQAILVHCMYLGVEGQMWRGGLGGLTWLKPGIKCAGSCWLERLDSDKTFVFEILQIKVNYR